MGSKRLGLVASVVGFVLVSTEVARAARTAVPGEAGSARALAAHAAASAAGDLTLADLVGHPERWPATVKTSRDMKFGADVVKSGTSVPVHSVTAQEIEVRAPQGFLFGMKPAECDILPAANTLAASLTPEERALTLEAIAKDLSLMPAKVALSGVIEFNGKKVPAGTELTLLNISGDSVGLWTPTNKSVLFPPSDTDIFARARERLKMPAEKRPGRMGEILKGHMVDAAGKPAELPDAQFYVVYVAASTCGRCKVFTPKIVEHFKKSLAERKDVAVFTEPTDATTPPMLAYVQQNSIPWPTLPREKHAAIYAMMELNGMEIPGVCVMDRFGNVLLSTKQLPGDQMEAAEAALAKLDEVLKVQEKG